MGTNCSDDVKVPLFVAVFVVQCCCFADKQDRKKPHNQTLSFNFIYQLGLTSAFLFFFQGFPVLFFLCLEDAALWSLKVPASVLLSASFLQLTSRTE